MKKPQFLTNSRIAFGIFLTGLAIIFGTFFATSNWCQKAPITYQIVGKTEWATSGKSPRLQWVFALKDANGVYVDKDVSFSTYTRFGVGDYVMFEGYKTPTLAQKGGDYRWFSFLSAALLYLGTLFWLIFEVFQ